MNIKFDYIRAEIDTTNDTVEIDLTKVNKDIIECEVFFGAFALLTFDVGANIVRFDYPAFPALGQWSDVSNPAWPQTFDAIPSVKYKSEIEGSYITGLLKYRVWKYNGTITVGTPYIIAKISYFEK
jgi:hypothetical protein